MSNPLTGKELRYGTLYALFQFLVLSQMASYAAFWLKLPAWSVNVAVFAINFFSTLLIYRRFLKEAFCKALQSPRKILCYGLMGVVLYYVSTFLVSAVILWLCPAFRNLNDASISVMASKSRIFMVIGTVIFVPTAEETLFRGLLFRGLYDRNPLFAWVLSVTLFSCVHILGFIGSYTPFMLLLAFFQYLPAGIILSYLYKRSDTIVTPILTHTCINLIGMCLM